MTNNQSLPAKAGEHKMKGCNNCAKQRNIKKECPWGGSYQHCGEHGEQIGICNAYRQETNADRIRAMSDEELADNRVGEILGIAPCPLWVAVDAPEKQYLSKKKAVEVELDWLQQPAPEEGEQNA